MNTQSPLRLAHQFLASMGSNAGPEAMAALCAPALQWQVPGDAGALPWIGEQRGRQAMADFVRDAGELLTREGLEIDDILANDARAIIVGRLQSRVNATGKLIACPFSIALTFEDDLVASFLLLEDSFAVSRAARG